MMTWWKVGYVHLCVALTALTGTVFAVMKYAMKPADEFSVINHPLQPSMLAAHIIVAPFLVFALGWLFGNHIWPRFLEGKRGSGTWSMAAIIPMALSGYLLQVASADATRTVMARLHWIASALFVIAYATHIVTARARVTARSAAESGATTVPSPT